MNKSIKLHLACGKEPMPDYRPILEYIKVTKEYCAATDRNILAVVPTYLVFSDQFISLIPENGFLLHAKDYKKLLKYDVATWKDAGSIIEMKGVEKRSLLIEVFKESEIGDFPDWKHLVEILNEVEKEQKDSISLNAKFLYRIQKSLGIERSNLTFFQGDAPIKVESIQGDIVFGFMYPIKITY